MGRELSLRKTLETVTETCSHRKQPEFCTFMQPATGIAGEPQALPPRTESLLLASSWYRKRLVRKVGMRHKRVGGRGGGCDIRGAIV